MRKTKGLSYDPESDKDVMSHIDSQQNGSQYVWNLVRRDMQENDIEAIIERKILKHLKNIKIETPPVNVDKQEIANIMDL